jgi:hypothetical protein
MAMFVSRCKNAEQHNPSRQDAIIVIRAKVATWRSKQFHGLEYVLLLPSWTPSARFVALTKYV